MQRQKALYENPFYNSMSTFMEPFPVSLVITAVSAAILRKRHPAEPVQSPSLEPL